MACTGCGAPQGGKELCILNCHLLYSVLWPLHKASPHRPPSRRRAPAPPPPRPPNNSPLLLTGHILTCHLLLPLHRAPLHLLLSHWRAPAPSPPRPRCSTTRPSHVPPASRAAHQPPPVLSPPRVSHLKILDLTTQGMGTGLDLGWEPDLQDLGDLSRRRRGRVPRAAGRLTVTARPPARCGPRAAAGSGI